LAFVVIGGGAVGWPGIRSRLFPERNETEGLITDAAKKGPFEITVTERGTLDSMKNAVLSSKVEGATTIISIVPEGTTVNAGDLVCELDSSTLTDKETAQEILVVRARAMLEQANEGLAIQKTQNDSDTAASQLKYDLAKLDLEKFLNGDLVQQVEDLQAAVKLADETLSRTQESCKYIREMTQKGYKNQNDLESEELVLQRNELDKKSAETKLRAFKDFTQKRTLKELEANSVEFAREIERTDRKGKAALAQKDAEVESCRLTLEVEAKKLERLKDQIAACKIRASQDGQVVYANVKDGRSSDQIVIMEGASVRERQAIINLPDLDNMKVNARIHESRISQVQANQKVTVKVDAYPGEVFNGIVDSVASVPSSTGGFGRDFKEYEASVKIVDDSDKVNKLRPGLTASVEILVERRPDVLQVPVQSVVSVGNRQWIFVAKDHHVKAVEIKVGKSNERMLEIPTKFDGKDYDSDLKEGDEVVMNPRSHFKKEIDLLESDVAKQQADLRAKAADAAPMQGPPLVPRTDQPSVAGPGGPLAAGASPGIPVAGGPAGTGNRPDPATRFKDLDKNSDGKLSRDEVADDRMAARFDSMDADADGLITLDEMKAASARFRAGGGGAGGPRPPAN
jgi:HlyD family secretion protein